MSTTSTRQHSTMVLQDTTFADTGVINSDFDGNKMGMTGLALKITPGIDLILPGEVICGGMAADSTTFQIQVTFTNINQTRPLKMCLYLCFENTGAVSLIPNGKNLTLAKNNFIFCHFSHFG